MIICCKDHICCLFCVFHFIIIEDQYVVRVCIYTLQLSWFAFFLLRN